MKQPALFLSLGLTIGFYCFSFRPHGPVPASAPTVKPAAVSPVKTGQAAISRPPARRNPAETKAPAPDWQQRLQGVLARAGQEELDVEIEDLARDLPADEWPVVLNLMLLPEPPPGSAALASQLLQRWAERAPAEAAEWLARLPDDAFGRQAFAQIATTWADKDLAAAVAWVKQLPDSGNKTAAQFAVATKAAEQKAAVTALKLAVNLAPSPERDRLLNYSVLQWATTDRDSAVAWAGKVSDTRLRDEMLGKIAIAWGIQDPPRAAAFVAAAVPAGKSQDAAAVNIVRFWGGRAPEQAAAWVEQFPDGQLRSAVMESLIEVWGRNHPAKAADWLNRVPASSSRDAAVGMFAPILARSSPEQAAHWAGTIQDEALRTRVQERLRSR